jgi:glutaredoxin
VYLIEKGISYQDIDVAASREVAHEMVQQSGQMRVPVILVDDELVVGFNQPKLDELMAK